MVKHYDHMFRIKDLFAVLVPELQFGIHCCELIDFLTCLLIKHLSFYIYNVIGSIVMLSGITMTNLPNSIEPEF